MINPFSIRTIKRGRSVPVIVDAGVGTASDACLVMEQTVNINHSVSARELSLAELRALVQKGMDGDDAGDAARGSSLLHGRHRELAELRATLDAVERESQLV